MQADFIFLKHTITTRVEILESEKHKHETLDFVVDHHPILNRLRRIINKPAIGKDTIKITGKLIPPVLKLNVDYDMQQLLTQVMQKYKSVDDKFDIHIKNEVYVSCLPQCIDDTGNIDFAIDTFMTKERYDIYKLEPA